MKKYGFWIALAVIAVSGGIAIAELTTKTDDPAVLACETIIISQLKSPKSYERVSAEINGSAAIISYDAVNSFSAPIRGVKTCTFELNDKGEYAVAIPDPTVGIEALKQEINALNKATVSPDVIQSYRNRIADLTKKGMEDVLMSAQDERSLIEKDWYPINPAKTKLTSDQ